MNVELEELKVKLYYLERQYLSNFDSWSLQENLYFLTNIKILKKRIEEIENAQKVAY